MESGIHPSSSPLRLEPPPPAMTSLPYTCHSVRFNRLAPFCLYGERIMQSSAKVWEASSLLALIIGLRPREYVNISANWRAYC